MMTRCLGITGPVGPAGSACAAGGYTGLMLGVLSGQRMMVAPLSRPTAAGAPVVPPFCVGDGPRKRRVSNEIARQHPA
jgi:hypothetical protein